MKVWITKYALTTGIFSVETELGPELGRFQNMVSYRRGGGYIEYASWRDWHKTEVDAIKRAEEMRLKKIESVLKQLDRLQALKFTADEVSA